MFYYAAKQGLVDPARSVQIGLSSHQALEILRALRGINLVGMDVVEVSPPYDHAEVTALAASYVAMEMLCLYAARHKVPA